jgi:serine/threonine protein kinase
MAQFGGKILGQGTYGCIFDKPLQCERRRKVRSNYVGKLTRIDDAEGEREAALAIHRIPNWSDYFIVADPKSFCRPKPITQQTEEDILSCNVVREMGFEGMLQFEMPLGGKDLYDTLRSANLSVDKLRVFDLIEHLLEAGALMVLNGFCHFDIHQGNILIDKNMSPKFIDFGDSFLDTEIDLNLIIQLRKQYTPSFSTEPPEILVIAGLRNNKTVDDCLMEMLAVKQPLILAERLLGISRNKQAERFRLFWGTSRAVRKENWVAFWKTYWPMVDSWSIGSVIIEMMNRIIRRTDATGLDSPQMAALQNILRMMLQINPRDRFDCVEALNMFNPMNKILKKDDAQKWLEKRQMERNTRA